MSAKIFFAFFLACLFPVSLAAGANSPKVNTRWSQQKANEWYMQQPWLVGSNYIPSTDINQLDMWQAATFDPQQIDKELGWAQGLGMNTMRVFLHDLLWQQDSVGFKQRIDTFLTIADRHHIRPMFVLFDSCWDPSPRLGPQHPPIPGVHNSGWMQSPGIVALQDPGQKERLEAYVRGVVGTFANDPRILAWDVWNEPDNGNENSYGSQEPRNKAVLVRNLLPQVFAWARDAHPTQPLTSGIWKGNWSSRETLGSMERIQIESSDIISFHNYGWPEDFEQRVIWLEQYHRPILCTEYMARGVGSTFDTIMPIARKYHVAAINWGLVAGKTQTYLPWDSWLHPYILEKPPVWFHDIFSPNGIPYRQREVQLIRQVTAEENSKVKR